MAYRGEVWETLLDPALGREQEGRQRPCLVVSADELNQGQSGLVIVIPMTRTDRRIPSHVPINPPEGGVSERSFIMCEQLRSISYSNRLQKRLGTVTRATLSQVTEKLRFLLNV